MVLQRDLKGLQRAIRNVIRMVLQRRAIRMVCNAIRMVLQSESNGFVTCDSNGFATRFEWFCNAQFAT